MRSLHALKAGEKGGTKNAISTPEYVSLMYIWNIRVTFVRNSAGLCNMCSPEESKADLVYTCRYSLCAGGRPVIKRTRFMHKIRLCITLQSERRTTNLGVGHHLQI